MQVDQHETTTRNYEPVARFYEQLAHVFSVGQIRAAKASQIPELSPGQRILYVGLGSGEDAILAAKRGAEVTCLDLSSSMLDKAQARFSAAGLQAEFLCRDVMEHRPPDLYDAVAANFFLNIFPERLMERVLERLVSLVRPGGKILIADFAPPRGNAVQRILQLIYYRIANVFYWALRLMPLHPIYDYARYFPEHGDLRSEKHFRITWLGLDAYRSLVAVRVAAEGGVNE
jgi:demethylmenaquinone methyltransferase/2-methoxy-6-polyprenyl-1,4-benzoquinol methylase